MTESSHPEFHVKSSPANVWAQTWSLTVLCMMVIGFSIAGILERGIEVFGLVFLGTGVVLLVWGLHRAAQSSMSLTSEGLKIRNFWGGYDLSWDQIDMIGWQDYSVGPRSEFPTRCVTFWLKPKDRHIQPVTLQAVAKVTSSQSEVVKTNLVLVLKQIGIIHGIPVKLELDDLRYRFRLASWSVAPTPWDKDNEGTRN